MLTFITPAHAAPVIAQIGDSVWNTAILAVAERSDFVVVVLAVMIFSYLALTRLDLPTFLTTRTEQTNRMLEIEAQRIEADKDRNRVQAEFNRSIRDQYAAAHENDVARHREFMEMIQSIKPILERSASAIRVVENFDERLTLAEQEIRNMRLTRGQQH